MAVREGKTMGAGGPDTLARPGDDRIAAVATALEQVAAALPPDRALILAVCDTTGRPNDLVVRDQDGQIAVLAGVPEDRQPELAGIIGLANAGAAPEQEAGWPAEALSDAERGLLMLDVVEHAPLPLMLVDRDGIVRYASSFTHDLGHGSDELVGNRLVDYVHPGDRDRLADLQERLARGERARAAIDIRWRRPSGSYSSVEARMRVRGDPHGPVDGGIVIGLRVLPGPWTSPADIVAAAHRHRVLADESDCGVAIVSGADDTLGVVLDANASLGRIVGATTGQLVGTSLMSLADADDVSRLRMALASTRTRAQPHQLEVALNDARGGTRRAEIAVRADATGPDRGELIVRVRDITDQLRLVRQLTGTVERLERTNHELAEFARVTAHDLSAPLLALSRLIDLVAAPAEDPDSSATFDAIRTSIKRMRAMIDGVMGYTESLEAAPARAPVDLDRVLDRALDALASEIADRRAVVTSEGLPTVQGDEHQLERVLLNLIANALKHSGHTPPRVHVEAYRARGAWRISVSDEGIGVARADRTRIFELLERGETAVGGRGIGLATSRRIVEVHGGRIWVDPNDPHGSTFNFTLPDEPAMPGD